MALRPALPGLLRALRSPNYRLFFFGQCVSLVGTWTQQIAMSWLVYRLTGSAFLLGAVGFADKIPVSLFTPFAGVFLDRWDLRRTVIVTQSLLLAQAVTLAVLAYSGYVQVWHLLALSVLLGLINAVDIPARQSFTLNMLDDRKDLGNAIALNSSVFNGARLIGPSLGGILIGFTSEGFCFLMNAISYLAVLLALLAMRLPAASKTKVPEPAFKQLKEGVAYAFGFAPIRSLLLLLALVSLLGMPYTVLMPVFATRVLGGGPRTLGFLMAATGCGALLGAVFLAARRRVPGLGRWIVAASALFGMGVIAFSFSRNLGLSLFLLVVAGFGMMVHISSSNTVLQTIADDDKRGRVMSFYVLSITGMAPFGSLMAGALASRMGAPATVALGGLCCIAGSLWFASRLPALRSAVHPIYKKMGLYETERVTFS